jgi:hypothetical protein
LKAYESAKKEIKIFQESTLSNRFASLAKSKGDALSRVASLGTGDSLNLQMFPLFFILYFFQVQHQFRSLH